MEREFFRILLKHNPDKKEKLFLVGRMRSFGYCPEKICRLIQKYNRWDGYNNLITKEYIFGLFSVLATGTKISMNTNPVARLTSNQVISNFLAGKPWVVYPPNKNKLAALYYHSVGGHVIPMRRKEKLPAVKWKEYQTIQPTLSQITKWDFSHGIILLGTEKHCFLDIDIKSDKHPDGIENFNESLLDGWYFERTKNGGYHVFGLGNMKSIRAPGVEIKGKGGYIVTYPTEGYKI